VGRCLALDPVLPLLRSVATTFLSLNGRLMRPGESKEDAGSVGSNSFTYNNVRSMLCNWHGRWLPVIPDIRKQHVQLDRAEY
jgi:hypothetical protein